MQTDGRVGWRAHAGRSWDIASSASSSLNTLHGLSSMSVAGMVETGAAGGVMITRALATATTTKSMSRTGYALAFTELDC